MAKDKWLMAKVLDCCLKKNTIMKTTIKYPNGDRYEGEDEAEKDIAESPTAEL